MQTTEQTKTTKGNARRSKKSDPRKAIAALRTELRSRFFEREDLVDGMLAALVAKQHVLMISKPGTTKSTMARALCDAIGGAVYFDLLLTKYTEPNEVFGAVDLMKWSQQGKYERDTRGYLPHAHLALLDEIFKSNSALLNSLLTAANERVYHDGGKAIPIPLRMILGASNEYPEGPELGALFDRFLFRFTPDYVKDPDNFKQMLRTRRKANRNPMPQLMTLADLDAAYDAITDMADNISEDVEDALFELRTQLMQEGIEVSDRRWVQVQEALAAYAYINGDTAVDTLHFENLRNVLWSDERERVKVSGIVTKIASPKLAEAMEVFDAIMEQAHAVAAQESIKDTAAAVIGEMKKAVKHIEEKVATDATPAVKARLDALVAELRTEHEKLQARFMEELNL